MNGNNMHMKYENQYMHVLLCCMMLFTALPVFSKDYFSEPEWGEYTLMELYGPGLLEYVILPPDIETLKVDTSDVFRLQYSIDEIGSISITIDTDMYNYLFLKIQDGLDENIYCIGNSALDSSNYGEGYGDGLYFLNGLWEELDKFNKKNVNNKRRGTLELADGLRCGFSYVNIRGLFVKATKLRSENFMCDDGHRFTSIILPIAITEILETPHEIKFETKSTAYFNIDEQEYND